MRFQHILLALPRGVAYGAPNQWDVKAFLQPRPEVEPVEFPTNEIATLSLALPRDGAYSAPNQ